jgi:pantothenate kinase
VTPPIETSPAALVARARALANSAGTLGSRRAVLGIAGAPGSGKSTLALELVAAIGPSAAVCGMDGFHLSNSELRRLGRSNRKGALDTFDGHGYVALLRRLASDPPHVVYAPAYDRSIEEAVAAAVPVDPDVRLVITEGNYLLVHRTPWSEVNFIADEVWFCELQDEVRTERLIARHMASGKTEPDARRWTFESDGANAELVATTRPRADLVVRLGPS